MEKHKLKPLRQKKVKLINKITNEVIIKDSMKEAAKFLNCSQDYITYLAKKKKARRDGWTVEKIQLKYRFKYIQKFNLCIK